MGIVRIINTNNAASVLNTAQTNAVLINLGTSRRVMLSGGTRPAMSIKNNNAAMTPAATKLVLKIGNAGLEKQNVAVVNKLEAETVSHGLGTTKLDVSFYNTDGRKNNLIDWAVVDANTIRLYLPQADNDVVDSFTGDVFFIRRG